MEQENEYPEEASAEQSSNDDLLSKLKDPDIQNKLHSKRKEEEEKKFYETNYKDKAVEIVAAVLTSYTNNNNNY